MNPTIKREINETPKITPTTYIIINYNQNTDGSHSHGNLNGQSLFCSSKCEILMPYQPISYFIDNANIYLYIYNIIQ